uniref:Uncharacterized protein n=1 Tax=Trypanosoma vivax (strain Y486) TaxID=1055687 RepID=G0TX28_TRYVY|nr:conserved hypothetical protein [Trypanosoma vivax Y486]
MTFPVLCASLRRGSAQGRPCPVLMEICLEALQYLHGVSQYPLQSVLQDAKELLPHSPSTFKLFAVTGALDLDTMRLFFQLPATSGNCPSKKQGRKKDIRKNAGNEPEKTDSHGDEDCTSQVKMATVPNGMLRAALSVALPPDCTKLFLSLFDNSEKFQQLVGHDCALAGLVLDIYGARLIPCLKPLSVLQCLSVPLFDTFVDIAQAQEVDDAFVVENQLLQCALKVWNFERLEELLQHCAGRKVRCDDALGSLWVCVFLYRVLFEWDANQPANLPIEVEARLWISALEAASLATFSTGELPSIKVQRVLRPLEVMAQCVRQRHTLAALRRLRMSESPLLQGELFDVLLQRLHSILDSARLPSPMPPMRSKKARKGKSEVVGNESVQNSAAVQECSLHGVCRWVAESACLVSWLAPRVMKRSSRDMWNLIESLATVLSSPVGVSGHRTLAPAITWESFQCFIICLIYLHGSESCVFSSTHVEECFGPKTVNALVAALQTTKMLECLGYVVQWMPHLFAAESLLLKSARVALGVWPVATQPLGRFYATVGLPSAPEAVGSVLTLFNEHCWSELAKTLLDSEQITASLIPLLTSERQFVSSHDGAVARALSSLQRVVLCTMESKVRVSLDRRDAEEEAHRVQLLESLERAKSLAADAKEFERMAIKREEAKAKRQAFVRFVREMQTQEHKERLLCQQQERVERKDIRSVAVCEARSLARKALVAEQRERLRSYCASTDTMFRLTKFLEGLQFTTTRIVSVMNTLRPHLPNITVDGLLEFLVTGCMEVPADILPTHGGYVAVGESNKGENAPVAESRNDEFLCLEDDCHSFWDTVMQMAAASSGEGSLQQSPTNDLSEVGAVSPACAVNAASICGPSFHKQVSPVLDLFSYSMKSNGELPDSMPAVRVSIASKIISDTSLSWTSFSSARDVLLACQQRGLCVLRDDLCELTPLGFFYHYPYHDPEATLEVEVARRRLAVRSLFAEIPLAGSNSSYLYWNGISEDREVACGSTTSYETENEDVVRFNDALL